MDPPPFENDRHTPQPESPSEEARPTRKWYRFTLRRFLIGFVILSGLFAFLRYTHWGYVAGEAITRMGRGVGLVSPHDSSKIRVTAVRPFGTLDYEWRVSIPPGETYMVCRSLRNVPLKGFPHAFGARLPRESLLYFGIGRSDSGERGLAHRVQTYDGLVPQTTQSGWGWANLDWTSGDLETSGILYSDGEQEFEPGQQIVLVRSVITQSQRVWDTVLQPGDGIMIWLEPVSP